MRSPQPASQKSPPLPPVSVSITKQMDHLILVSGCRVTAGCSTSVLTSRVGNARPSPWLQEIRVTSHHAKTYVCKSTIYYLVIEGMAPILCLLPGEHRQEPVLLLVPKDLRDILLKTQREAILVGASSKNWCSEGLCRERPLNGCANQ